MPFHRFSAWTDEEDATLRQMAAEGKSASLIAARLRRSPGGVKARARMSK